MRKILHFFILFMMLTSCSSKEKNEFKKATEKNWSYLEITISNDKIREKMAIFSENRYCKYSLIIRDSSHFKRFGFYESIDSKLKLKNPQIEKLALLFKKVIQQPASPPSSTSCYNGDYVSFTIHYDNSLSTSCDYASIGDWQNISPTINEIYNLTFAQLKKH